MEIDGGGATSNEPQSTKKRKPTGEEMLDDLPDEKEPEGCGVKPVELLEANKYADMFRFTYKLYDARETTPESMRLWLGPGYEPAPRQQVGCHMLQIFSLKLSSLPVAAASAGGPIQLYGFMAVRDPLDPLRNYVFNCTRDDPFVIQDLHSDPFIYLSGPKRGVFMPKYVLVEYDMKIKRQRGGEERDHQHEDEEADLPLIRGVAIFSLPMWSHGAVTNRIIGDHGAAVDISRSLIPNGVEVTVQVWIEKLTTAGGNNGGGIDLSITGRISKVTGEIKVFRGVIDQPCKLNRFVIAVSYGSCLFLDFQVPGGSDNYLNLLAFKARRNGAIGHRRELDFATVYVRATCSILC